MTKIQYTGTNFDEVKSIFGDRLLAPYFCMGITMLSLLSDDGFVTVNEGDYIILTDDGQIRIE